MDIDFYTDYEDIILNAGEPLTIAQAPQGWKLFVRTDDTNDMINRVKNRYERNNPNKRLVNLSLKYVNSRADSMELERQIDLEIRDLGIASIDTFDKAVQFFDIILFDNGHRLFNNQLFWSYFVKMTSKSSLIVFDKQKPRENNCFCFIHELDLPGCEDDSPSCCKGCLIL